MAEAAGADYYVGIVGSDRWSAYNSLATIKCISRYLI